MKRHRTAQRIAGAIVLLPIILLLGGYAMSDNDCSEAAPAPEQAMTAVVYCEYGGPAVLQLKQVAKPVPGDSQVLVRIRAAAVNPYDWHLMRGTPYVARIMMGLRKPKETYFGVDFAGTVEVVGSAVTELEPGDDVFGRADGALAQYAVVTPELGVVKKPQALTFEQAAAVPIAAITALQAVRDHAGVRAGTKVLINGASGGVGTFAVQIAKALGGEVTGVNSTRNVALVRSLGADHVIDYTRDDFTRGTHRYDAIVDNVGNHSLSDIRHVLKPDGRYIMIGGDKGRWFDPLPRALRTVLLSKFVSQDMRFFAARINQQDLTYLSDLMSAGRVTPVIDRQYSLSEVRDAIAYLETGRARGKVVVTVE